MITQQSPDLYWCEARSAFLFITPTGQRIASIERWKFLKNSAFTRSSFEESL